MSMSHTKHPEYENTAAFVPTLSEREKLQPEVDEMKRQQLAELNLPSKDKDDNQISIFEVEALRKRIGKQSNEIKEHYDTISRLQSDNQHLRSQQEQSLAGYETLQKKHQGLENKVAPLETELKSLHMEHQTTLNDHGTAQQHLHQSRGLFSHFQAKVQDLQKRFGWSKSFTAVGATATTGSGVLLLLAGLGVGALVNLWNPVGWTLLGVGFGIGGYCFYRAYQEQKIAQKLANLSETIAPTSTTGDIARGLGGNQPKLVVIPQNNNASTHTRPPTKVTVVPYVDTHGHDEALVVHRSPGR